MTAALSGRRTLATARRVLRQLGRDRRTLVLLFLLLGAATAAPLHRLSRPDTPPAVPGRGHPPLRAPTPARLGA
ncbi:hypothetical protein QNO07_22575 [Streptomyces sp. 549]|uniref:hypothetical protein n=1 Tax=Streptomyces sp. 549 TaxID=3049076 RepID=UPI0024C3C47B|nr:hypothetical protein [Streptomyces sp. 549]MDK1476170.1 hypothetical protein [Streptomyces sp. 549]